MDAIKMAVAVERAELHPGAAEHGNGLVASAPRAAGPLADEARDDPLA